MCTKGFGDSQAFGPGLCLGIGVNDGGSSGGCMRGGIHTLMNMGNG